MHPLLHIGPYTVASYGVCIVAGTALGLAWLVSWRDEIRRPEDSVGRFWQLLYVLCFGGLVGGKLGFVIVELPFFWTHPARLWRWNIGWVYWFAALGVMVAGKAYQEVMNRFVLPRPRAYLPIADYCATAGALGHWVGRIGCFLNGCCHGKPTTLPWGVVFTNPAADMDPRFLGVPLHPTQLIEAAGELAIGLWLARAALPRIRSKRWRQGTAFILYVLLYSALRFSDEFLRGDDRGVFLSPILSPSQWVSAAAFLAAAAALWMRGVRVTDPARESPYLDGPAPAR
ncbi:MAG: prolipoprotein diacylglyceryl transferase [Elusimicrobia bacterium]|nr:prolipoprotein diacylglyceryl transferase [Elusimicrobiota bacterium]